MPRLLAEPMNVVDQILKLSRADETEAVVYARASGLTRFASSVIHQNVYEEDAALLLRVAVDHRVAGIRTNRLSRDGLQEAVDRALAIARLTPPDPAFPGLADPQPVSSGGRFVASTADASPEARASRVRTFVEMCADAQASGALETEGSRVAIGNSRGVRAEATQTQASFVSVVDGGDSTGYVEAADADLERLPLEALAHRVMAKVQMGRHPREIPADRYTVILEPPAVGLLMNFLGVYVFSGKAIQEGRSYLVGRVGQRIVDERVSLWDDATDPRTIGLPFDLEGVPKRKVTLIEQGVARSGVYDMRAAKLAGTKSTGHALPQPNAFGPIPMNLFLSPGERSLDELIRSTARGLLLTRFHYVRIVDPLRTIITGMTRDGTFLIEEGQIVGGVKNLRFNQSMIEALANVEAIGADAALSGEDFIGKAFAPPLVVRDFNFTGTTTF